MATAAPPPVPTEVVELELGEDLDLVDYTLRAIGVVQAVQHMPSVRQIEENLPVFQSKKDILCAIEATGSRSTKPSTLSKKIFKPFKATRLITDDIFPRDSEKDPLIPFTPPDEIEAHGVNSVFEIRNIYAFMEAWQIRHHIGETDEKEFPLASTSSKKKVNIYWALTLLGKTGSIVFGILGTIPTLAKLGVKYWTLPTGDKVPLASLRAAILETLPSQIYTANMLANVEADGPPTWPGAQPYDLEDPDFRGLHKRKVTARLVRQDLLVIRHPVLYCPLPDGTNYIVDPTGRLFGYVGVHKSLIVHGREAEYVANFPGTVIEHELAPLTFQDYEGGPDAGYIPVLIRLLEKHLRKRICRYCGQLDAVHPSNETARLRPIGPDGKLLFDQEPWILLKCQLCGVALYCSRFCQKFDWARHKDDCKKIE